MSKQASKLLFVILVAVAALAVPFTPTAYRNVAAAADQETADALLRATVRITMYAPVLINGERIPVGSGTLHDSSSGLGTLVRFGSQVYIVTHNHWAISFDALSHVRFKTVENSELQMIVRSQFLELLRYHDAGTLILLAPDALQSLPAVEFSTEPMVKGMLIEIPYRDPATDTLEVIPLTVDGALNYDGAPAWRMRSVNSEVVYYGNSGAGVFVNGRLAGNVWMKIYVAIGIPGNEKYIRKFDSTLSSAAPFPVEALAALTP